MNMYLIAYTIIGCGLFADVFSTNTSDKISAAAASIVLSILWPLVLTFLFWKMLRQITTQM